MKKKTKAISQAWQYILLSILVALILILGLVNSWDPDTPWHLKTGEIIAKTKSIPHHDIFSHTAYKKPWIPESWLFELLIFLFYNYFGLKNLIYLKALFLCIVFVFLFQIILERTKSLNISLFVTIVVALFSRGRFTIRPHLTDYFFLVLLLFAFQRFKERRNPKYLLLIPFSSIIWVNFHPGAFIGLFVVFLFAFSETVKWLLKNKFKFFNLKNQITLKKNHLKWIWLAFALSIPLLFITPSSYHTLKFLIANVSPPVPITEMSPTTFKEFPSAFGYLVIILLTFLSSINKIDWFEISLILMYALLAFKSIRFQVDFSIVTAPTLGYILKVRLEQSLSILRKFQPDFFKTELYSKSSFLFSFLAAIFMIWIIWSQSIMNFSPLWGFGTGQQQSYFYPEAATNFILQTKPLPEIVNDYNHGGYLIWKLYPQYRVFMDGRTPIYRDLFNELKKSKTIPQYQKLLKEKKVNIVITQFTKYHPINLYPKKEWALVFWDDVAVIYLRRIKPNEKIIKKYEYKVAFPNTILYEVGKYKEFRKIAQVELRRAIKMSPNSIVPRIFLSYFYVKENLYNDAKKELDEAFKDIPMARTYFDYLAPLEYVIGNFFLQEGNIKGAIYHFKLSLKYDSSFQDAQEILDKLKKKK